MLAGGIDRFRQAIERVREINPDFAISQLSLLLYVATNEGKTMHELCAETGMPQGSVSRNIKQLSRYAEVDRHGRRELKGYNLVRTEPDVIERRRLAVYLTKEGEALIEDLYNILYG